MFPSSHASPAAMLTTPSPHIAAVQSPSHDIDGPLVSQVSIAAMLTTPSPHIAGVQSVSHIAVSMPSSQVSTPAWILPSPHLALRHVETHASVSSMFPSSHSSPICTILSPQLGIAHAFEQASSSTMFPSSHASTPACTKPSPQAALLHIATHASVSSMFPSSHASPAVALRTPSPQAATVQSALQLADSPPSSHASLPSTLPSPHTGSGAPVEPVEPSVPPVLPVVTGPVVTSVVLASPEVIGTDESLVVLVVGSPVEPIVEPTDVEPVPLAVVVCEVESSLHAGSNDGNAHTRKDKIRRFMIHHLPLDQTKSARRRPTRGRGHDTTRSGAP